MADRTFYPIHAASAEFVILHAKVSIGATGAPTLVDGFGVASISRTSAGLYSITLKDAFVKFINYSANIAYESGGSPAASAIATIQLGEVSVNTNVGAKTGIPFLCLDFAGVAADPEDGSVLYLTIIVKNSIY